MKKLVLLLAAIMLFSMTACSRTEQPDADQTVAELSEEEPEVEQVVEEEPEEEEPVEEEPVEEEPEEVQPEEEESAEGSAYDIYVKAAEALNAVDSLRMDMTISMGLEIEDVTQSLTISTYSEQVYISETEIDMKMDITMDIAGEVTNTLMYYKDGMAFMEMYGMKMKQPMDFAEVAQQGRANTMAFPQEAIMSQSMNEVSGNKEISFTLDGNALSGEMLEQMNSLDPQTAGSDEATFGVIEMEVVVDSSGNIKSYNISSPYETTTSGYVVSGNMDISMEILQIGGVTVDFPTDLDTYQDLEELQE